MSDRKNDEFMRGYLVCVSDLVAGYGSSTEAEELFRNIGSPSAAEVRRLGLTDYDRNNLSKVRKAVKR